MAETNLLTSGNVAAPTYPTFQPIQQPNMLTQMGDATNLARGVQALQQQQFDLGRQRLNYIHDLLGAIAAKVDPKTGQPNATFEDVTNVGTDLLRMGIPPEQVTLELQKFSGLSPAEIQQKALSHMAGIADHASRMGMGFGNTVSADQGGGKVYGRQFPQNPANISFPGATQSAGGTTLPNIPDPSKLGSGPPVRDSTGAVTQPQLPEDVVMGIARGQYKYSTGPNGQILITPAAGQAPQPGPGQPQSQRAAAQPTAMGIPGVPAGAAEAANVSAKNSAQIAANLVNSVQGSGTRQAMLSNLEGDLNKFTTGPYADLTLRSKRGYNDLVNRTGVPLPQWDTAGVAAHENFNKQATQLAQQQFTALGGTGTDQQLGSAFKANPNDALSDMGNRQIVALLKGNEDAIQAMNTGWQNWKKQNNKGDDSFPQFQQEFMRDFSPRAFQWVRMSPADRAQMATEMKTNSPGEFVQLRAALTQAEQHGWIKKNSVQAPNAGQ